MQSRSGRLGRDIVDVTGGRVAGTTVDGVRVFKGIPFAAPPVGELRWRPPQPVVPWAGMRQADAFGPAGQSAGSWSANAVQATPLARSLFHRIIGQSGALFAGTLPRGAAEQGGLALARAVGVDSLAALRAVPAERLVAEPSFRRAQMRSA